MARNDVERSIVTGLMALGLISSAWAQDVGTPSREQIEKVLPKPPYSPYADRDFPTRPFFGDTHLHTSFSMDAGAFGARLGPRDAYRFARGEQVTASSRPAGEALAPARLPRGRRPFRQHGLLSGPVRGQARGARRSDGPPMVRHDPVRQGRGGRHRDHRRLLAGDLPEGSHVHCPARGPIAAPGRRRSPPPSSTTSRAASPPSSATSGPRTPAATTCIATSSSATTATRRARSSRSPCIRRSAATTRPSSGSGWQAYEKKTGGSVLAIAHNGNLSNGLMFPVVEAFGKKIDREYAEHADTMGAALRGHADQGRRRGASVPVAERRVRQLRALGQRQSRRQRREDQGDARIRVCPLGAEERPQARTDARRQSLQVRPHRQQRRPHGSRRDGGGQLLRQDHAAGAQPGAHARHLHRTTRRPASRSWTGRSPPRATPPSGRRRTPARRCGMPCSAGRPMPRPGRAWSCGSSAAGTSSRRTPTAVCPPRSATPRACRWAASCGRRRRASRRPSWWRR